MAKSRSRKVSPNTAAKSATAENGPHVFQVFLRDTSLTPEQVAKIAESIREAATGELLSMDFRIEELQPLSRRDLVSAGCGGGCRSGTPD